MTFFSQKQNCDEQDIMIEGSPGVPEISLDLTSTARFDLSPGEKEQGSPLLDAFLFWQKILIPLRMPFLG